MRGPRITRRTALRTIGATTATVLASGRLPGPRAVHAAPAPGALRFGVQTVPQHTTYQDILPLWEEAEELGLDTAFVFDHFIPIFQDPDGPCLEGWTLLSALAARTERLRVGILVTGNTYRHPAVLAKMAATVDQVSAGRLILGLGAAWFEREHTAYGIPFHTPGGRARRLVEAVEVMKKLFTQETTTFDGKYYRLQDAPFLPKTVQRPHPPILIGGMGPKVIQPLAARHADIWHFFVRTGGAEAARKTGERFDAICREVGRDPAAVEKSTSLRANEITAMDAKALRAHARGLVDAGVRHLILGLAPPFDRKVLRRFADDVAKPLREA